MHRKTRNTITRMQALLLSIILFIGLLPHVTVFAADDDAIHFYETDGAVLIDSSYNGKTVIIHDGVFSVTVFGATDVNIRFVDVTIDRYHNADSTNNKDALDNTTVPNLYKASSTVSGDTGNSINALVCPFYITGNSTVTAGFTGNCTFYAGTNTSKVNQSNRYTASDTGGGYAGIQVDSGSSLTITDAENLKVYGAHQLGIPYTKTDANGDLIRDDDGNVILYITGTVRQNNQLVEAVYSDTLRANANITGTNNNDVIYRDPFNSLYEACPTGSQFSASGGAGIGGGVSITTTSSASSSYTQGTPGTIIINGGNIEAFGGYAAAGIGGGVNGAATTSSITINGGNVIAHGGRFAAGIGDGDSVPKDSGLSPSFNTAEGRIEINGGTVTAYGGVASAGIGCTDDMTTNKGSGEESKLEIAINGGVVRAYSGFPSNFSGSSPDGSPAAIGAGSISRMESNSIYISSESDLLCAGFGDYSLTENGTATSTIPVINVDSDGYLLLLKTGSYVSIAERTLEMWLPQTETISVAGKELLCTKYIIQDTGNIYYRYIDAEGNSNFYEKTGDGYYLVSSNLEGLTLYVDGNSEPALDPNGEPIKISLAYYFQSMAITLPDPADQGGLYAITVPTTGITGNVNIPGNGSDIILTVEAHEQGTQSGTIQYPSDHNMSLDNNADKLTDLDIFTDAGSTLPTNGLIGDEFLPGVFAYTVYVEPNVTSVSLQAQYKNNGRQYHVTLDGTTLSPENANSSYHHVGSTITLTEDITTVRLRKQDGDNSVGAITYKVTIIRKAEYLIDLSDPSKTYDGTPAVSVPDAVGEYEYNGGVVATKETTSTTTERNESEYKDSTSYSSTVYITRYRRTNYSSYQYYIADLNLTWVARPVPGKDTVQYICTITTSKNSGSQALSTYGTWYAGWEVTYVASGNGYTFNSNRMTTPPSDISSGWISGDSQVIAVGYNTNLNLVLTSSGARLTTGTSTPVVNGSTYIFSIGDVATDSSESNNKAEKQLEAQQAFENGASSGTLFAYSSTVESNYQQSVSVRTIARNGNTGSQVGTTTSKTFDILSTATTTSGAWKIVSETSFVPSALPEGDLEKVVITYQQTHDAEGNTITTTEPTTTPPTDAGKYIATAELRTKTYNAYGERTFTISRREVRVQQIEKWLTYLTSTPADKNATLVITDPGDIILENVVSADMADVSLQVDIKGGNVYYRNSLLNYESEKIALKGAVLDGDRASNYTLFYDDEPNQLIYVFGQIALDISGSTFRKTATGNWEKYYPEPDGAAVGTSGNPPDYHSPSSAVNGGDVVEYRIHSEYVRARTVNDGSGARYAVDIEYGAMHFGYYRGAWDVNSLSYVEFPESHWEGMDGSNNRIVLNNYSNAKVYYSISANIYPYYGQIDATRGIRAWIAPNTNGTGEMDTWTSVAAAKPGDSSTIGSKASSQCFLFLEGVPQMPESILIEVGTLTVTLTADPPGSS